MTEDNEATLRLRIASLEGMLLSVHKDQAAMLKVVEAAALVDYRWKYDWDASAIWGLRDALVSLPEEEKARIKEVAEQRYQAQKAARLGREAEFDAWMKQRYPGKDGLNADGR